MLPPCQNSRINKIVNSINYDFRLAKGSIIKKVQANVNTKIFSDVVKKIYFLKTFINNFTERGAAGQGGPNFQLFEGGRRPPGHAEDRGDEKKTGQGQADRTVRG